MSSAISTETRTSDDTSSRTSLSGSFLSLLLPILGVGAVLALVPLFIGESRVLMGVAVLGLAFAGYTIGFNLIFGSTGQLFLCVGALAGIGGYGAAILADDLGWPIIASILAAAVASTVVGGLLSYVAVSRSLGVIFTGIITLIFTMSYDALKLGLTELTGGDNGRLIEAGSETLLRQQIPPYYVMLGLVMLFLLVYGLLKRSHFGWAFRALRDDEVAAVLAGVDVARYRVYAAIIGSAMLGLAGATYALSEGRVSPTTFGFGQVDVVVLVMYAFGGPGSIFGPIVGAVVFTLIDELMIEIGRLRHVAYGALVILLFLRLPRGLLPTFSDYLKNRRQARQVKQAETKVGALEITSGEVSSDSF